ncbi:hypothetical protein IFR04_012135 [Cadophora malorum]|uniref:Uncharacterized protein n=1 Tax=Cadophora malorum TaxID=108018 RepID=A0A8H7W737_9HELO|nr:hypothetical protein IFR04_012135 [Cadophora malorum]
MLPESHNPGDKTLYLLAKLSKEFDRATASRLLNNIVANVDIRNVPDRINPSSLEGPLANQRSIEPSQRSLSLDQENSGGPPQSVVESSRVSASLVRSERMKRPAPDRGQVGSPPKTPRISKQPEAL